MAGRSSRAMRRNRVQGVFGQFAQAGDLAAGRGLAGGGPLFQAGQAHVHGREGLAEFVVDLPGDAAAFVLHPVLEVGREVADAFPGFLQLFLAFSPRLISRRSSALARSSSAVRSRTRCSRPSLASPKRRLCGHPVRDLAQAQAQAQGFAVRTEDPVVSWASQTTAPSARRMRKSMDGTPCSAPWSMRLRQSG